MPASPQMGRSKPRRYVDIDEVRDVDGVIAVISKQVSRDGSLPEKRHFAAAFFKEFMREDTGDKERTAFVKPAQFNGLARLLQIVDNRIDQIVTLYKRAHEGDTGAATELLQLENRASGG